MHLTKKFKFKFKKKFFGKEFEKTAHGF